MADLLPATASAETMDVPGQRLPWIPRALLALIAAIAAFAAPAAASHDPNRSVTVFVPGFDPDGAGQHGVYGADVHRTLADSLAALAGLPAADTTGGPIPPNAVCTTDYYGDTPPAWFTAADRSEVELLTAEWGGGVPRYAYIVARFAQHALQRSGADQVNFVSGSFGSLIVRWLIEHDVAGLSHAGRIARWLSIEGVVAGNWAASRGKLVDLVSLADPQPIDVDDMKYDWVDANVHAPRTEGDSPFYSAILLGQTASTDDGGSGGPLSTLMLAYKDYLPNDGVQAAPDTRFATVTAQSKYFGMAPTTAVMHSQHLAIKHHTGAYAEAAAFLTGRRRVTVTLTSARVVNLHEIQLPFWDWRPAEVVFQSRVFSPAAAARWGISDAMSEHLRADAAAPLWRFQTSGETQTLDEVVFDDLVLPEEKQLRIVRDAHDAVRRRHGRRLDAGLDAGARDLLAERPRLELPARGDGVRLPVHAAARRAAHPAPGRGEAARVRAQSVGIPRADHARGLSRDADRRERAARDRGHGRPARARAGGPARRGVRVGWPRRARSHTPRRRVPASGRDPARDLDGAQLPHVTGQPRTTALV